MNLNYSNMINEILTLLGKYNRFLTIYIEFLAILIWYILEIF
jgi:hypothetical protein